MEYFIHQVANGPAMLGGNGVQLLHSQPVKIEYLLLLSFSVNLVDHVKNRFGDSPEITGDFDVCGHEPLFPVH